MVYESRLSETGVSHRLGGLKWSNEVKGTIVLGQRVYVWRRGEGWEMEIIMEGFE